MTGFGEICGLAVLHRFSPSPHIALPTDERAFSN